MIETVLVVIVLAVFAGVVYLLERNVKQRGALFTGLATPLMRVLALLGGLFFGWMFVMELTSSETIHVLFPILAVALFGYALGAGGLLKKLQGGESGRDVNAPRLPQSTGGGGLSGYGAPVEERQTLLPARVVRFLVTMVIVLCISALALIGAVLAVAYPNHPLSTVYVVGIIVLFGLAAVGHWFGVFKGLFK